MVHALKHSQTLSSGFICPEPLTFPPSSSTLLTISFIEHQNDFFTGEALHINDIPVIISKLSQLVKTVNMDTQHAILKALGALHLMHRYFST